MTITAEQRRARILDVVRELGTVRVVDLAERIGLAAVTVRRDVAGLADAGLLHRSHGAVSLPAARPADARATGQERVVGMLVPTVGSYFDEIIDGARSAAAAAGARLVLGISAYESSDDRAQVEQLLDSGVDGLLLTPNWKPGGRPENSAWIGELRVPVVLVERRAAADSRHAELNSVGSDHHHGVLVALRHLASLGHGSVLLAARDDTWTAYHVRAGYEEGTRLLGLEPQPVVDIHQPGGDMEVVAARIAEAVAGGVRAALVHNDQDAIQLVSLLRARGLRVPDDVALISYDDVFAALAAPPLTAVAPPKRALGAAAMRLLLRWLDSGPELPVHHVALLPELKIRTSCGGVGGDADR
ncbi:substrate-binding domain-containing protein [Kitasatospora atroaurantiaca]|uniref:DNA-binding LacI/PurR family transcriptional regulator n=1 Tax=Kitasatospora atroaurantiaca TaxID=285545 RepID=A0A561EI46_9ACTN|nr:LacI family DNA-binding transcriptional regulator [Kitasatospora atroaurantiaca]TWE15243.1 DNA-binding LacI/PurR family transcriptional regulator [Kitasatospora atroaurantiaca]